eukprot:403340976
MLQSKSDQLNQSLLSNPPENNQTQGDMTQEDGVNNLTEKEDRVLTYLIPSIKKTTFDFEGNSEQHIKTSSLLVDDRHKYAIFIDNKVVYQDEYSLCLRDLSTNAEPIQMNNPYCEGNQFKLNDGQHIAFLQSAFCIYRLNDIFDPANTYDDENETWSAKCQKIQLQFGDGEIKCLEVIKNHFVLVMNSDESHFYNPIEEEINIELFFENINSKIDYVKNAPVRLLNLENDNLKGFSINRSCELVHFHENYIVLKDCKGSDSFVIDFDLMKSEEAFNVVHTIPDPITFVQNSNMYLTLDKSKTEYLFYKIQKKIKDDDCTHKLKQISNKQTQNISADFDIKYAKLVDQNQMIYLFGKYGKNNPKTQNALRSKLIMIDQVNMIVLLTSDQNILIFKSSENDCEVMICESKDYPVKFEKTFNFGFGIQKVHFGSNNEEIIFSPTSSDADHKRVELIEYNFLEQPVFNDWGQEKVKVIHDLYLPKTKVTVYVVNEEKTLLFLSIEDCIKVFDLVNICFIESLSIKNDEYGQPFYLSFIDSKMQLVLRINEKSLEGNIEASKAVLLTVGMKNNEWKYTSKMILNDFYEYKMNALMGDIKNSESVFKESFEEEDEPPSKVEFEVATDNSTNIVTHGRYVKNNNILMSLKSIFGESYNMSNSKFDYFLVDGLQEQRLPTERVEVNYLNQRYDIFCDIDQQHVTFVQQQFYTDDIEALLSLKRMDDLEIIAMLKSVGDISKFLMHYPQIGNLISIIAHRPRILQYLIKHLELQDKSKIPMLMYYVQEQSPFDKVTQSNQVKSITYLLEILVRFQNHHSFNHFIDKNLISLIEKQINLNDYFESNLPIIKINHKNFQDLHYDDKILILSLKQTSSPKDILEKYDEIFNEHLDQSSQAQQQPIEYFLVNLPDTLTNEPRKLMEVLSQTETMELFETLTIQTIINFKWNTYTKSFFQTQFNIFLIFCLSFMIEILYSLILVNRKSDPITDDRDPIVQYSLKSVSGLVLIYFLVYEFRQAAKQEDYMKEIWNFFDYSLIIAYALLAGLEAAYPYEDYIVILKLVIVFLTFLKINFFLRIYDGFSFLVSMMAAVFVDLKYFIGFFVIFILQFGLVFAILFDAISIEEYQGIGIFAYIMMAFRTSSGDFNVDSYKDQSSALVIISWIIWIIAVMLLNVMFMNFIIAVISESYEKVMQKLVAESYRVKVQMIVERELHFTEEELTQEQYFPKYLILRRPVSSSEDENGEWQGFVKDIKNTIKTSSTKQKSDIQYQIQAQTDKMEIQSQNLKSEVKIIKDGTEALQSQLETVNKQLVAQENKIELLVQFINEQKLQNAAIIQLLQNPKQ